MKKFSLRPMLFGLISIFFIIEGCNKVSTSSWYLSQESNVNLVPESVIEKVAQSFKPNVLFNINSPTNHYPFKSTLNGNNSIKNIIVINDSFNVPAIYVCNFENNQGFLFVSADSNIRPILGYCHTGEYKTGLAVPWGFAKWLKKTIYNIEGVRKGIYADSLQLQFSRAAWSSYFMPYEIGSQLTNNSNNRPEVQAPEPPPNTAVCGNPPYPAGIIVISQSTSSLGPLLPVTWGQACTFNELCPNYSCSKYSYSNGTYDTHALTGCVATAMSQVIKFWSPSSSAGIYNYAAMPATTGNSYVQQLMFNAGISVYMDYGCSASSAYSSSVAQALKQNFSFSSANYESYSDNDVLTNLGIEEPVLLSGDDVTSGDGHEWVCDGAQLVSQLWCQKGYTETNTGWTTFHMNWGWHEWFTNSPNNDPDYNGWFAIDNWTTNTPNCGGTTCDFQYADDMTTEIHP